MDNLPNDSNGLPISSNSKIRLETSAGPIDVPVNTFVAQIMDTSPDHPAESPTDMIERLTSENEALRKENDQLKRHDNFMLAQCEKAGQQNGSDPILSHDMDCARGSYLKKVSGECWHSHEGTLIIDFPFFKVKGPPNEGSWTMGAFKAAKKNVKRVREHGWSNTNEWMYLLNDKDFHVMGIFASDESPEKEIEEALGMFEPLAERQRQDPNFRTARKLPRCCGGH